MKLKFKHQQYQTDAVNSVISLFKGQPKKANMFSLTDTSSNLQQSLDDSYINTGFSNVLYLDDKTLEKNMHEIQKKNELPKTDLESNHFSIEMETGTGKTFVYSKTIFELNKQYGFLKFIIVVPSVAIREGVSKSFDITHEEFMGQYDNVPYNKFVYNSKQISNVKAFATSNNIEVMIINIDAFKKDDNIINQFLDRLNGETAISFVQKTNPIVIIDEPQSVDNTPKSAEAIKSLNPLCVLRYSATHRNKVNLLYRLTPVDAYYNGLVKQICVYSSDIENDNNKPYIKLLSVSRDNGFKAKIEIDVQDKAKKITRKTVTVKPDTELYKISGNRDIYEPYRIIGMDSGEGKEQIEFFTGEKLNLGKALGVTDESLIKREQIRKTIETHLDKELRLLPKNIKVLSLFFIDKVENYRDYESSDTNGIYAKIFEEEYNHLINLEKYKPVKDRFYQDISKIHDGYFSKDNKGFVKNTKGDTKSDESTYNTIMKDKEWLLSFECPLRFIWSHSALKEGWDNPNVFQVCTLIDQKSMLTARQKIGRGLRLCVDQDGNRIEDKDVNILHVLANESFATFADNLQKEIEEDTGLKFGYLQINLFTNITYEENVIKEDTISVQKIEEIIQASKETNEIVIPDTINVPVEAKEQIVAEVTKVIENKTKTEDIKPINYQKIEKVQKQVTYDEANEIMEHFKKNDLISNDGKIKETMKKALYNNTLSLPTQYDIIKGKITDTISKANREIPVRDVSKEVVVKLKKNIEIDDNFLELWDKIKQKTVYNINIDLDELKEICVNDIKNMEHIEKAQIITRSANLNILDRGISHIETGFKKREITNNQIFIPDILTILQEDCGLNRTIAKDILVESKRLQDFLNNPELFIEKVVEIIKNASTKLQVDGIKYTKVDGLEYSMIEIFPNEELMANIEKNALEVEKSTHNYCRYDSTIEERFAMQLERDENVKFFFKIPPRFKIDTPLGKYNPDWAVYIKNESEEKLYFVIETKGSTSLVDLRTKEQLKIKCGKEHFEAIDNDVEFKLEKAWK